MLVGLLAGSMPLDPLINSIYGRTKMLKNRVVLEKRELLMQSIKDRLAKDFFASYTLQEDLKMDFFYYFAENEQFLEKCDKKTDFQIFEFLKIKYEEYQNNRTENRD